MIRFLAGLLLLAAGAHAQQAPGLYIPRDIARAYAHQTRSPDGRPGKNYFQNTARYNITVRALPPDRNIQGREQITYFNHSPDTLKSLVIKLIQNIHRPGVTRYGDAAADYLTTGLVVDSFAVAGQPRPFPAASSHATWQQVGLPRPLLPHDSVQLSVAWHFPISLESGREGMIDKTTYFLAYFYPRIAVYDDYNGWDRLDFTDSQEFYNDFNDYTLQVQVPAHYLVWATGTLQNPQQVLQAPYAKRLARSLASDAVVHVATAADLAQQRVTAPNAVNTWRWRATNISDVAVGLSNHYVWDAASVVVDGATRRRASVQAAYADSTADFHQSVANAQHALAWFSNKDNWPGVPYPFPKMTAFQGFADMEYPMMVNDSPQRDPKFAQLVQDHEIAHTWFPFYMGINESRYAFMDEGWATTLELLIGRTENPVEIADAFYRRFRVYNWIYNRASSSDLPVITPSSELRGAAYSHNAYVKPSLSYLALKDMLGDALFKKCLHEYMARWHGKHPIPWDYFNSFSDAAGQNLNWFFNNWFFSNNYIDLAVESVTQTDAGAATATIANVGGFAVPIELKVTYGDGSSENFHQTPAAWQADPRHITVRIPAKKRINSAELIGGIYVDANPADNKFLVK